MQIWCINMITHKYILPKWNRMSLIFNSWFPRKVLVMIYKLFFHKFKENCVPRKCLDTVLIATKFHFLILNKFEKINFCTLFISIVHLKVRFMMFVKLLISAIFYFSNIISQIEHVVEVLQSKQSQHLTKT